MIDPTLQAYLNEIGFLKAWEKLKKNFPLKSNLIRQFHAWFDGLATFRLVHYLTEHRYPKVAAETAIQILQRKIGDEKAEKRPFGHASPSDLLEQVKMMEREK